MACKAHSKSQIYGQLSCKNVPKNQKYIKSLNLNSENREADGDSIATCDENGMKTTYKDYF